MSAPVVVFPLVRQARMRATSVAHMVTFWRVTGDPAAAGSAIDRAATEAERRLAAEGVPPDARRAALGAYRRELSDMADAIARGEPPEREAK